MPEILRSCRNFADFHDNILVIHSITELWSRWSDFSVIIWGVVKLSGTFVYVNDVPVLPLNNNLFYLLQDVRHCHEARGTDPQYCREGWGCRRLRSVTRYIGEQFYSAPMWYRYGKFTAPGVWKVDRDQIARQLAEEAALSMSVYCPFYDAGRVYDAVMALPKVIRVDDNWMIDYRLDYRQDGAVKIPVNILHRIDDEEYRELPKRGITKETPAGDPTDVDKLLDDILAKRKRKGG